MAYPAKRTDELVAEVLERLSGGEPLAKICRDQHMPDPSAWRGWCDADECLAIAYARAREDGFDAIAMEIIDIADDKTDDPASRRVRTDVRLKLLAKWDPKRYGEMIKHAAPDGVTPAGIEVIFRNSPNDPG